MDKNKDYIEVGWANLVQSGVDVSDIYKFYQNFDLNRYEMTLGFRVWAKYRVPTQTADQGTRLLFDVILEDQEPYCSNLEPVFSKPLKEETLHVVDYDDARLALTLTVNDLPYPSTGYQKCGMDIILQIWLIDKWI